MLRLWLTADASGAITDSGVPRWVARGARVSERARRGSLSDIVFFYADREEDLARLAQLTSAIQSDGMILVLWPKGQKRITGNQVMAAARAARLMDVKICSVSEVLSGLKLMIPEALRQGG